MKCYFNSFSGTKFEIIHPIFVEINITCTKFHGNISSTYFILNFLSGGPRTTEWRMWWSRNATMPLEKPPHCREMTKGKGTTWTVQHDEMRASQSYELELMSLSTDAKH